MSENSITKKMSAAAFFNENRAIAGFGNSMRAVFTSIRELVENGLDSAEKRGISPVVSVDLRKLSSREINELLDVTQYKKLEKHLDFLQLSCRDNGVGVPGNEIADLFGRVLTGTKYGVIQTRGRFGLGAKMCLLYSMSSVDLPAKIRSRYFMDDITHEMHLMINLEKNEPIIMEQHEYLPGDPNYLVEPGLEISITFTGAWRLAKNSVKEYFRQLAIITPYSTFKVRLPGDKEGETEDLDYDSVVDDMPPPPQPVKIHPWGCDITQFKAELAVTRSKKLKEFLATQFMGVTEEIAEDFFQLLEIDPNKSPKDITSHEIRRIVHEGFVKAYQEAKDVKRKRDRIFQFDAPRGTALSPLGANRLRRGLEKELQPKFVEAVTRAPKAYSGHPFVIEAALGYGGGVGEASQVKGATVTDNKIIYRYANRIPLVFGAGNDVITHVVSSIRWNDYGLTRQSDPLAIAVSLVSTKIPFPETSKEYISIVPEIEEEIRLALMQLGRRLKTFLSRAKRKRREHARLSRFVRSAPIIVENLTKILEDEDLSYTDFRLETDRIAAALAHGATKKVKLFMPLGKRLFGANVWCPSRIQYALKSKAIESVADFLITPSEELVTLLSLSEEDIYNIKLRTISELDREGMSPRFDPKIFVSRTIEKRFVSDNGKSFDSLKDSLYRRWIQNSYHYFATDYRKLQSVAGLPEKLFENMREDLLHQFLLNMNKKSSAAISSEGKQLIASLTKTADLKIQTLFPSFNYLKDNSKGLIAQETTIEEFLFQTKLPTTINYQAEITAILVNYLKNVYSQLCDKFPDFAKTNITKLTPDWTDAYTKNAFHRRKIKTIEDFVNANLDELIVIKELERKLYASFMDILSSSSSSKSISLSKLQFSTDEGLKQEESEIKKILTTHKISTLLDLIYLPVASINNKKFASLRNFLLKESKYKLLSHIRETKQDKDLSHIKIISLDIERELKVLQIFTTSSFLAFPSIQLRKVGLRKKDIEWIKKKLGTPIPSWIDEPEFFKTEGIVTLEELFYNPPEVYSLSSENKKKYTEISTFLRTPLTFAFPSLRKNSNLLYDVGINCIGRFTLWTNSELAEILNLSEIKVEEFKKAISVEEINKNRATFGKDSVLLKKIFPKFIGYFDQFKHNLQDLFSVYPTEKPSLIQDFWKNFESLNKLSNLELIELTQIYSSKFKEHPELKDTLLKLKLRNIVTIRQFLDLLPEIIESELNTTKERKLALNLYNKIKTRDIEEESEFNQQIVLLSEYDEFLRSLALPISRISGLTLDDYDKLRNYGIIAIHQIFDYTVTELASILGKEEENITQLFDDFSILKQGTFFFEKKGTKYESLVSFEFEESERFSSAEIVSLILSGYDTIDKIFYLANPLTFSSAFVNWNVIEKFRKLLRSPLTLVTWEQEIKRTVKDEETDEEQVIDDIQVSTLSTLQLNTLRNHGITKIIDLLVSQPSDLVDYLEIQIEEAQSLQRNVRISDTGIDLSELGILESRIVRELDIHNIVTIEDLYFSTSKDKWTIESLPWDVIESFKAILNLPLYHISDMLDPEIIEILRKASISTLLGFMLSSPEALMEKTGIADERFETIKNALDLSDIFGYFSLPVYFLPSLSFTNTEILRENGIKTIAEFIMAPAQKISKLTKAQPDEIKEIIISLTTSSIQALYENKGIFAFETQLFDRHEQRVLSRDSIFQFERFQTIQELYYSTEEQYYYANPEIWKKISAVQKYLTLPLKIFTEISEYSMEILEQNNIDYVYQLLFIPDADLTDPVLFRVVSTYSSKIIIMQAFHYFANLPATVYNSSYFKKVVQDIESKTLFDVITDNKVIKDLMGKDQQYLTENYNLTLIRSILELPLRITPFFTRIRKARREEYKDVIIGDVFEIDFEEHSALQPFYSRLLENDSLDRLIMELAIPIASMGLPRTIALKLSKSSVNTLIDFFSIPVKQISEITGNSQKEIREIKEALTYSDIVAFRLSQAHIVRPSEFLSEKKIEELKDIGISDIESLFYSASIMGISEVLSIEEYKKTKELLSGSIRFIGFLSYDELKRLEFHEINSVIDLALVNKDELHQITQNPIYQEFHALDLISFDELAERRISSAIPLSVCPSIEEDYLEKLNDIGINSIQDFISRMEEIRESRPALVKLDIFREVQLYRASVAFIGLDNNQVRKLIYSGVGDILSFITEDISTIALLLKMSEKKVQRFLDRITPENLMKEVKRKGVKLEEFSVLSKGKINSLLRTGKEYVQDLYSLNYQAYPSISVSGDYMRDFLNACHISVYRIKELSSEDKLRLIGEGILRLIDLFNSSDKDLKSAFEGSVPKEISKIRKGVFTLSKGAQLKLNEPIIQLLKSLEFDPTKKAAEDLFGFIPEALMQLTESDKIVKTSSIAFIEQLVSFLCLNVLSIPGISIPTKSVLWNKGIKHVIELLSLNLTELTGVSKETTSEIRIFKREFDLSQKMSETFSQFIDHSLSFPNKAERQFMKYGLSSALLIIDFIPHPVFELDDLEKSTIRIATSNMFKPISWLTSDLSLSVKQLISLAQIGGINIISGLLLLSQNEQYQGLYTKTTEFLNKSIIQFSSPDWAIKLEDTKIITDPSVLKKLKDEKIVYLDELLSLDSKIVQNESLLADVYPLILSLKSLPLYSVEYLTSKQIDTLKGHGIKNLYQYLLVPSPLLSTITKIPEEKITRNKTTQNIKLLEQSVKQTGLDLSLFPEISQDTRKILADFGCVSLVQASKLNLDLLPLSNEERNKIVKLTSYLLTPITLIGKTLKLKDTEIKDLLSNGITTYTNLLEIPPKNWSSSLHKLLDNQKEDPTYLVKLLKNIKKQGIGLEKLTLSAKLTAPLLQIGVSTIEHLYFIPIEYIVKNTRLKSNDINALRDKLSYNISYLSTITQESIDFCYEKGLTTIIEHLIFIKKLPKNIQEEILHSLSLIKSIRESGFVEPLSEMETYLQQKGFSSYKALITSPSFKEDEEIFAKFAPYLLANLKYLDVDQKILDKWKNADFTIIADLFFMSPSIVASTTKTKVSDIQNLIDSLKIDNILQKIDTVAEKTDDEFFFLSTADRNFLKSIGIYSLNDLAENSIYDWLVSMKKIQQIRNKTKSALVSSILYYPSISEYTLSDIKRDYFEKGITTVQELISISNQAEKNKIIGFMKLFSANKETVESDYIPISQYLENGNPGELFSKKISTSNVNTVVDLVTVLEQNKDSLSILGHKINQSFQNPVSSLSFLSKSDTENLALKGIFTVGELIIKPSSFWTNLTPASFKETIISSLSSLSYKKIETDVSKKVQLSKIKIFDADTKKEILKHYATMDDLIYSLKQEDYPISKALGNKIQRRLNTPIQLLLFPNVTIKSWQKLLKSINTIEDLYLLTNKELSSILSLKQTEVGKLRYSLAESNIGHNPIIKENKLFSKKDIDILKQKNIKTYVDLFDDKVKLEKVPNYILDKIKIFKQLSLKDFDPYSEFSLSILDLAYLAPSIDKMTMEKKQRDSISTIINFIFSKGLLLSQILNLETKDQKFEMSDTTIEYLLLLEKHEIEIYDKTRSHLHSKISKRFKELVPYLSRSPILLAPNRNSINQVAKLPYRNIRELLLEDSIKIKKQIAETTFLRNLRNISINLLNDLQKELTNLPSELLSGSNISQLEKNTIYSIEEAITFNKQSSAKTSSLWKLTETVCTMVETELLSLPTVRQSKNIQKLVSELKLVNIYDLLFYCKSITPESDKLNCVNLLPKLSSTKVERMLDDEQKRLSSFIRGSELAPFLRKQKIRSFGTLIKHLESKEIAEYEPELIELVTALRAPINLFVVQERLVSKLEVAGIVQVIDFIAVPDVRKVVKMSLTEQEQTAVQKLQSSLSLSLIKDALTTKSYPIEKIGLFDKNMKKLLKISGYTSIAHLNNPEELIASTSKLNKLQITRIHKFLETPIYYLTDMIKANAQSVFLLHSNNITNLWDLFATPIQQLSKIVKISVKNLRSLYASLNPDSLKQAEKDQVEIRKTLPHTTEGNIAQLKGSSITTLQALLMPDSEMKQSTSLKDPNVKKLIGTLEQPIGNLEIKPEVINQIKQLGITSIKDFVVYPAAQLDEKTDLSYMVIKSLKSRLPPKKVKATKKSSTSKPATKKATPKKTGSTVAKPKASVKTKSTANKSAKARQTTLLDMTKSNTNSTTVKKSSNSKKKEDN